MERRSFLRVLGGTAFAGLGARVLHARQLPAPLPALVGSPAEPFVFSADRLTFWPALNSGQRVVMDEQGVRVYDAKGLLRVCVGYL